MMTTVTLMRHVIERWRLLDSDTLHYEATVEDPTVFTRPWTMTLTMNRIAAGRIAISAGERRIHTHEEQQ